VTRISQKRILPIDRGFTIVELLIVIAILGTLAAIALPVGTNYMDQARSAAAIMDIRTLEKDIVAYEIQNGTQPDNLSDIDRDDLLDPWGNPYQYLKITGHPSQTGSLRKDRFLVPVNTDYDLYSMGKDGTSMPPFTANVSRDDIVRANDGGYVGKAEGF